MTNKALTPYSPGRGWHEDMLPYSWSSRGQPEWNRGYRPGTRGSMWPHENPTRGRMAPYGRYSDPMDILSSFGPQDYRRERWPAYRDWARGMWPYVGEEDYDDDYDMDHMLMRMRRHPGMMRHQCMSTSLNSYIMLMRHRCLAPGDA